MTGTNDLIVVGLGAVGSACLYQAAKRGIRVLGIDRFAPPHDFGSSHGGSRITRQAIGEGREFVPLVLRSNEIWRELEQETGRSLITQNGGLILASPTESGDHHGSRSFIQDTIAAAEDFGIAHEKLTTGEVCHRYPQFRLTGNETGYFEPGAGFLRPEMCVTTHLGEAQRLGASIHTSETVIEVKPNGGSVEIASDRVRYSARTAILTVGPWINDLVDDERRGHFKIYRQVMNWFAISHHPEQYTPDRFPVFIWLTGSQRRDMLYGFPALEGAGGGLKISTEQYDFTVNPSSANREVSPEESSAMYDEYIQPRFPDISRHRLRSQVCLYTVTPDAKFVIDQVKDAENIWFASACSGHGFKHSAALGEALVMQTLGEPPPVDLSPFRLTRLP